MQELKKFIILLKASAEYDSIENTISLPWSNGPVEGFVNKLKIIKRQMYGKANFELLRKRMILNTN
ncbi:transposase [Elizabethkingia sp. YR214]|uniref:transposase n=1 Tax=Elizabethkingia sp. YR214 TaxID=2135667 RepID=UPI000D310F8C|nr:transposase [Elizabethkingia sp. YR214]